MGAMLQSEISEKVNSMLAGRSSIKLLEAGCGSASYFTFAPEVKSVGIDISREQLDRNKVIHEKILGDLQTYSLPEGEFDVVVCWDVIEHLSRPRDALMNMFRATRPDGVVILGFPNLASFKGVVTKMTPLWFHTFFYWLMKYKSRPFKTYLRFAILPTKVVRFAEENGFSVAYSRLIEGGVTKQVTERFWPLRLLLSTLDLGARVLTFGKSRSLYLDSCAFVLKNEKGKP
jgi:2-polyprenyl-3-methyl-5-hydroxy-6-metoxy-1,4-benzoquinol methylase